MRAARTAWMLDGSAPSLGPHRDELLEEQRVALGALARSRRRRARRATSSSASSVRQRLQGDDGAAGARREPPGAHLDELGPPEAQDAGSGARRRTSRRSRGGPGASARPSGRRRPRARAGAGRRRTRAAAARPRTSRRPAPARRRRGRRRAAPSRVSASSPSSSAATPAARLLAAELAHDLRERAVGDVLAVGQAAADRDRGVVADVVQQLADQPRLADAGGSASPSRRRARRSSRVRRNASRSAASSASRPTNALAGAGSSVRSRSRRDDASSAAARRRPADRPRAPRTRASRSAIRVPARISPSRRRRLQRCGGGERLAGRPARIRADEHLAGVERRRGPARGRGSRARPARRAARRPRAAR